MALAKLAQRLLGLPLLPVAMAVPGRQASSSR